MTVAVFHNFSGFFHWIEVDGGFLCGVRSNEPHTFTFDDGFEYF